MNSPVPPRAYQEAVNACAKRLAKALEAIDALPIEAYTAAGIANAIPLADAAADARRALFGAVRQYDVWMAAHPDAGPDDYGLWPPPANRDTQEA